MVINHNLSALNAQTQYNLNVAGKNNTMEKLSSGYRINRAADDAAGLKISEKMRLQIRGLDKACNNVQDGSSLTQTADGALDEVHGILQRQRELLVQAANDTNTTADREAIETELIQLGNEQDRIYDTTQFNGIDIFKGHDKLIAGPFFDTKQSTDYLVNDKVKQINKTVKWYGPNDTIPADSKTNNHSETVNSFTSSYSEEELLNIENPNGHNIYTEKSEYTTRVEKDIYDTTTEVKYEKQPANSKYTNLIKPGTMVGSNGYINVKNEARDLDLSCAMSQLGIQIDGKTLSYSVYSDSTIPKTTITASDKSWAKTTYDLGNNMQLTQTITLLANQSYEISYKLTNNDPVNAHTADVRLAFDTLNTQTTAAKDQTPYTLENDTAKISINAEKQTHSVMSEIDKLYNRWDDNNLVPGTNVPNHTGAGFWWEGLSIPAGTQDMDVGKVIYGPITLKKEPYEITTTTTGTHQKTITETVSTETSVIEPEYIDIQASDQSYDNIPIRLYDLSTKNLKEETGEAKQISAFHADDSLPHMDRVINKISTIRTYYGAMQNRLSSTHDVDAITEENVTASESRIRDTDMSAEIVKNSKYNILLQTGEAMISQANQSKQHVLELLTQ